MKKNKIKNNKSDTAIKYILGAILLIYALSIVLTLLWGILTSFKSRYEFNNMRNVLGIPTTKYSLDEIRFGNFKNLIEKLHCQKSTGYYIMGSTSKVTHVTQNNLGTLVLNTILYAVAGSLLQAIVPCVCAYLCAKFNFKFSKFIYALTLFVMIIPIVGSYPAQITMLRDFGLYDTFLGYFFQKFNFTGMYFFVYYAFFDGLSNTYSEAAEIDGASRYRILISIILPISIKIITTVWLLQFVTFWNDYQTPILYMPTKPTLAYAIYYLCFETSTLNSTPMQISSCMFLAVPLLILFILFKDKLMGNITMGGIKE